MLAFKFGPRDDRSFRRPFARQCGVGLPARKVFRTMRSVDVVIPVRDGARFLPACLDSVLAQTYAVNEVIVVDDGSTDGTPAVVSDYARRYANIRSIRSEAKGVSHARNLGIRASGAELIAFVDSDDVWKPDKIARQVVLFERPQSVGFVHCAYFHIDEIGAVLEGTHVYAPLKRGDVFRDLLEGYPLAGSASAVVARRDLLLRVDGFDEALAFAEDMDVWIKMARLSALDYVPEALVGIREHPASVQRRPDPRRVETDLLSQLYVLEKWYDVVDPDGPLLRGCRSLAAAIGFRRAAFRFEFGFHDIMCKRAPRVTALMFADARVYRSAVRAVALPMVRSWLARNVILRSTILLRCCQMVGRLKGFEIERR
jgi:glycosyltransferase involved in cell wall biosynthesis